MKRRCLLALRLGLPVAAGPGQPSLATGIDGAEVERPPGRETVTSAWMRLTATDGCRVTLIRVSFGGDSRFPPGERLLRGEGPGLYPVFRTSGRPPGGSPDVSQPVGSKSRRPSSTAGPFR